MIRLNGKSGYDDNPHRRKDVEDMRVRRRRRRRRGWTPHRLTIALLLPSPLPPSSYLIYMQVRGLSLEESTAIMNDPSWKRVLFLRDPAHRLLSAYMDKVVEHTR